MSSIGLIGFGAIAQPVVAKLNDEIAGGPDIVGI